MRLVIHANNSLVNEISCDAAPLTIGSREDCRVYLADARVAPQHALLTPQSGDAWTLEPADPAHVVLLNGEEVTGPTPVRNGDHIGIAHYELLAVFDEEPTGPARAVGKATVASMTRFVQFHLPPGTHVKRPEEHLTLTPAQLSHLAVENLRLGQCAAVEQLMEFLLRSLLASFGGQRAWLGIRRVNYGVMEYVEGRLLTGTATDLTEIGEKLKPRVLDRGQFLQIPHVSPDDPSSVMVGPLAGPDGTLGMVYLDTGDLHRRFEHQELDYFIVLVSLAAAQLDQIFKEQARQRAATMEGEVAVAHVIQSRITPRKLPQWESLQWGAFREPGHERTGDIYDVVKLSNQSAAFMVAHTRSAGALPCMLMAQAQSAFRSACMHLDSPQIFMRVLNHVLYDGNRDHPLECFMGLIDPATGELRYALAGWMGAYIISARGEERRLGGETPAPALGLERTASWPVLTDTLEEGETLALFTPGVTTARSRQDQVFGEERFVSILCDGFGQLASATLKDMLSDLKAFTEGGKQPEDITVLLSHRV